MSDVESDAESHEEVSDKAGGDVGPYLGWGRPRKYPRKPESDEPKVKRSRGRPRKGMKKSGSPKTLFGRVTGGALKKKSPPSSPAKVTGKKTRGRPPRTQKTPVNQEEVELI